MKTVLMTCMLLITASLTQARAQTQEGANEKFAAEDWSGAIADYRVLLDDDSENAQIWFNLASALHQLEDYEGARDAYLAALDAGYPRTVQVHLRLARVYMSLGAEDEALKELEEIARTGGPNGRALEAITEFAPLVDNPRFLAAVKALTPCAGDEFREFDFWIGEWEVTGAGSPRPTAKSRISSKQDGCVVLEEYSVGPAFTGMSINFYDSAKKIWHQTWMSNTGGSVYLEGGLTKDGAMRLTDESLAISEITGVTNRVTWTPHADGSVRQYWEASSDGGKTWSVSFDGNYTRKDGK
jgi:tetratricopeptide (TPR) repeat protein